MDLSTTWLGLPLKNPLIAGASPLADDLGMVRQLEDAGAAAIVLRSLFEEQIERDTAGYFDTVVAHHESTAEAAHFLPQSSEYLLGPEKYLAHLEKVKKAVSIPVVASLNGITPTGWLSYANLMAEAGADALELNLYHVATDARHSGAELEQQLVETVHKVTSGLRIPVAVKLSPYYSSLSHLSVALGHAGARGAVLFNRFYQPDIDIENLDVLQTLKLSDSSELLLRLRWLAILYGRTQLDLSCSGGVHSEVDVIKALMAGARTVQMVSELLHCGPQRVTEVLAGVEQWLTEHEYESLSQCIGTMSLWRCPNPAAFERGNYMRILQRARYT
ncbi:MAG: dihydroorotate dehydrogenase-like protein [Deltaproteobacteria bacterium]|nr:dihydroorotate dehydrogenase-like protein [Deltaproteobacteria bacterium]